MTASSYASLSVRADQIRVAVAGNSLLASFVGGLLRDMVDSLAPGGFTDPAVYGAVGNGATDDKAALLLAITAAVAANKPVSGLGKTYGIAGNLTLVAGAWLQDIKLKQLTPAAGTVRTLTSAGGNGIKLVRVAVDRNGSGASGVLANDAGVYISGGSDHYLEDVEVFGNDAGTGIAILSASNFDAVRLHAHDMLYSLGADPGDDRVQGIWFDSCTNFRMIDPKAHDMGGNFGAGATTRWSRGIVFGGCTEFTVTNPRGWNLDQGQDVTGSAGNTRFSVIGGLMRDCYTWGFKFANSARDGAITGAVAERCGYAGFVAQGPSSAGLPIKSSDIVFENCTAYDTASNGFWSASNTAGFLAQTSAFDTDYPRGIKFLNCRAIDRQGVPTMKYGFRNDTAANVDGRYNECVGCTSIGHTVAPFLAMNAPRCALGRTTPFSVPNNAWTTVNWDSDDDRGEMHDTVSNNDTLFTRRTAVWNFLAGVDFAANAAGQRGVRLQYNGIVVPGSTVLLGAAAAGQTSLHTAMTKALVLGRLLRVEVFQNSGGALNLQTTSGATLQQVSYDTDE